MLPDHNNGLEGFLNYAAQTTIDGAYVPPIHDYATRHDFAVHHAQRLPYDIDYEAEYARGDHNHSPRAGSFLHHHHDGVTCHYVHGRCNLNDA